MIKTALIGVLSLLHKGFLTMLPVFVLEIFLDALDEAAESFLESAEAKAKKTPEKKDDRRVALLRKHWSSVSQGLRKAK